MVIYKNEPLSKHSTFKIGGIADRVSLPETIDEFRGLLLELRQAEIPYIVVGNGSNILFSDSGFRGNVVKTTAMKNIQIRPEINEILADAGVLLVKLARVACDNGLSGLEFATGIPGTIGGAIYMNAGAYGGEMADVVQTTTVVDTGGKISTRSEHDFGYRHSVFSENDEIILQAAFRFTPKSKDEIRAKMQDNAKKRLGSQPTNLPSAGSVFKRPDGVSAGKLIQDCGLAGVSVGDAQISPKHCGFIVNNGNASARDVLDLIALIKETVLKNTGVALNEEIQIIGE
ncbi:MAG: UDP-N-acetylmuramate dehydrogenase [Clostridiales bacterium]|jgi:UDP-N-acetylmuramate dehydrogenase|nr:UDP-N-acetylmuramate dehydrogenase [Clostridiales bacterium]